tara:strand:+ start:1088 stop:1504 length:417 start_codon:yes stop_codon:yes gene_type:complete
MSLIRNSKLVNQAVDFTGVQSGKIHPSDVDFVLEFSNKILILGEVKRRYNRIPKGQEYLLTRIADRWGDAGIVLKVEHEHNNEDTNIPLKDCFVTRIYVDKTWKNYEYGEEPIIPFLNRIGVVYDNKKCQFNEEVNAQ